VPAKAIVPMRGVVAVSLMAGALVLIVIPVSLTAELDICRARPCDGLLFAAKGPDLFGLASSPFAVEAASFMPGMRDSVSARMSHAVWDFDL
jgi:hypothetical protein